MPLYVPSHTPTWKQGFARNAAEARNPSLWKGLVGLWMPSLGPTGLTLRDLSGFGSHGILTNMDPATDWVAGEKGWTLDYDGSNDYVDVPDTLFAGMTRWSVGGLILSRSNVDSASPFFGSLATPTYPTFRLDDKGGGTFVIEAYARDGAGIYAGIESVTAIVENTWYYVWQVYDGDRVKIYINGQLDVDANATNNRTLTASDTSRIGGGQNASVRSWNGFIANVSIHNRVVSVSEIQQLYGDPHAIVRQRARWFPAAVVAPPAGGTTNPFSLGAVNLLAGKI